MKRNRVFLISLSLLFAAGSVLAQSGGDYDLVWQTFGSAGDQFSQGGDYQLGYTLAQDTPPGISQGGDYQMVRGYWLNDQAPPPTAVTLVGFGVDAQGDALRIAWETASEVETLGFNLYRSESGEPGSFAQLNDGLIPSQAPGSPLGACYEWVDADVEAGRTYSYLLETVATSGQRTQFGPVEGSLPTAFQRLYYLPIVQKAP